MIVLDTNVISELIRPAPERSVLEWLDSQDSAEFVTTAITAAELLAGGSLLPTGRRRDDVGSAVEPLLSQTFDRTVLPFDVDCAALIVSARKAAGQSVSAAAAQIAATCSTHAASLATRNIKDFLGMDLAVVNPWANV